MLKFKSIFWQSEITPHFCIAVKKEGWTSHIQNSSNNLLQNHNSIIWTPKNHKQIFTEHDNKASTDVINTLYVT
jgi:hypothetical protein